MGDTQNQPFQPNHLPLENIDWQELIDLMGKANRYIARYDGLLQSVVNPDILLSPLRTREAVLSSKIEGTQATVEEVMEYEADKKTPKERRDDINEVINYRIALLTARKEMEEKPLSLNVIRNLHRILMSNVRGGQSDPGNFRRIQNWIGTLGTPIEEARFIPPAVPIMKESLYDWENYLHYDDKDLLVQLAIVHAQFEIIHPFLDANGRIGRILIPLFLYHKGVIQQPVFYMSDYLESNRSHYYNSLKEITDSSNWTNWIRFFLKGVIDQAEKNINRTRAIIKLYEEMKIRITEETHSQFAIHCLDFIFSKPIFNSTDFYKTPNIPRASAARLIRALEESKIVECMERGAGRRPSVFAFRKLINIVNH